MPCQNPVGVSVLSEKMTRRTARLPANIVRPSASAAATVRARFPAPVSTARS